MLPTWTWVSNYWLDKDAVLQNTAMTGGKNNAYFLAYECINTQLRDRVYGNVSFKGDIAKGLDLTVRGGLDMTNDFRTQRQATSTQAKPDGWYREQNVLSKQYSGDFLLKYNTRFAGDFEFTGNIGGSIIWRSYANHAQTASAHAGFRNDIKPHRVQIVGVSIFVLHFQTQAGFQIAAQAVRNLRHGEARRGRRRRGRRRR